MKVLSKRWLLAAAALAIAAAAAMGSQALAGSKDGRPRRRGSGRSSGLLPRDHLTEESAIQVDLSKETVRLPLYKGTARTARPSGTSCSTPPTPGWRTTWASTTRPSSPTSRSATRSAVQTVTLDSPTPQQNPFGQAVVELPGRAGLQPDPDRRARADRVPAGQLPARRGRRARATARSSGSPARTTVYSAPIVATGDGPFDVVHHTNTGDRVLGIHIAGAVARPASSPSRGSTCCSSRASTPASRSSTSRTDAGQPLTAVLERSTYVPALDKAAYNGGDDFLGSARERLFGFINGQTGADNPKRRASSTWSRTATPPRTPAPATPR